EREEDAGRRGEDARCDPEARRELPDRVLEAMGGRARFVQGLPELEHERDRFVLLDQRMLLENRRPRPLRTRPSGCSDGSPQLVRPARARPAVSSASPRTSATDKRMANA